MWREASPVKAICLAVAAAMLLAGCGGGADRQDAEVERGEWTVSVSDFKFPKRQPIGDPVNFELTVKNDDTRDIPQLVVTISGLRAEVNQEGSETRTRPIWILNDPPGGESTPYNTSTGDTFDLGRLEAGDERKIKIPLTPIRRGKHTVNYTIATSLFGGGVAKLADGSAAEGSRTVAIDPTPHFDRSVFE